MIGIRHTDVKGISSGNPGCPPPVTCGDSPVGACGSASLRWHLRCFGSRGGNLADVPVRPKWALSEILSVHPSHLKFCFFITGDADRSWLSSAALPPPSFSAAAH